MNVKKEHIPLIILAATALFSMVMGVLIFRYPPAIFPDPSWGFQVMRSMEHGGGFNLLVGPSQADLAKNTSQFLTWWSPGQYLAPYLFKSLFGVNTGQASALTITFCQLLGLAGFYLFFKRIGFSPMIAAISLVVIATEEFYSIPYVFYNGGEVLVFGFAGWYLLGCVAVKNKWFQLLPFVFVSGLLAFFCKSSLMWVYAAGLCFVWIRLSNQKKLLNWITNGVLIGIPAVLALGCIFGFFLSKGVNPTSGSEGLKLTWEVFSFPIASPLLAGFSVDELLHGLIYHADSPMFSYNWSVIILVGLAIISLALVIFIIKKIPLSNYRLMILVFYIVSFIFFGFVFLKQSAISYEGRHLRIMGLIIVPGVVYLCSKLKPAYIAPLLLIWLLMTVNTLSFLIHGYNFNKTAGVRGNSGIAQEFIDQPSLKTIIELDKQYSNAIFAFTSPDLGLEILRNRIITLQTIEADMQFDPDEFLHDGHAGPVFIVLPKSYAGAKAALIFKCFPGYKNFTPKSVSAAYTIYSAY